MEPEGRQSAQLPPSASQIACPPRHWRWRRGPRQWIVFFDSAVFQVVCGSELGSTRDGPHAQQVYRSKREPVASSNEVNAFSQRVTAAKHQLKEGADCRSTWRHQHRPAKEWMRAHSKAGVDWRP